MRAAEDEHRRLTGTRIADDAHGTDPAGILKVSRGSLRRASRLPPRSESGEHQRKRLGTDVEMLANASPEHGGRHVPIATLLLRLMQDV